MLDYGVAIKLNLPQQVLKAMGAMVCILHALNSPAYKRCVFLNYALLTESREKVDTPFGALWRAFQSDSVKMNEECGEISISVLSRQLQGDTWAHQVNHVDRLYKLSVVTGMWNKDLDSLYPPDRSGLRGHTKIVEGSEEVLNVKSVLRDMVQQIRCCKFVPYPRPAAGGVNGKKYILYDVKSEVEAVSTVDTMPKTLLVDFDPAKIQTSFARSWKGILSNLNESIPEELQGGLPMRSAVPPVDFGEISSSSSTGSLDAGSHETDSAGMSRGRAAEDDGWAGVPEGTLHYEWYNVDPVFDDGCGDEDERSELGHSIGPPLSSIAEVPPLVIKTRVPRGSTSTTTSTSSSERSSIITRLKPIEIHPPTAPATHGSVRLRPLNHAVCYRGTRVSSRSGVVLQDDDDEDVRRRASGHSSHPRGKRGRHDDD